MTDGRGGKVQQLFSRRAQGQYGSFLFVDPMANLLAWSEDFTRPDWQPGLLQISTGAKDPLGTMRACAAVNPGQAEQSLTQTLNVPGDYVACLSVWARSDSSTSLALTRDGLRSNFALTPAWTRYSVSGAGVGRSVELSFLGRNRRWSDHPDIRAHRWKRNRRPHRTSRRAQPRVSIRKHISPAMKWP